MDKEEGSLDQGPAGEDTLRSSLEKHFDEAEKATGDVSEAGKTLASARKPKELEETPQEGAETTSEDVKATETTETPKEPQEAAEQALEAPQHWPANDRELFGKQPKEVQTWLLNRHKAMEADYTRKTQEVAPMRRLKEGLDEVFAPFREKMALDGIDEMGAIKQLVAAHTYLQRSPQEAIGWLAQQYGIDLNQVVQGAGEETLPPQFAKLQESVQRQERIIQETLQRQEKEQLNANLSQVEQFADQKDAQGKPLHPHFDDVAQDVAKMLKAGIAENLQDAYDRAVYANPQVRQKVLAAQEAERRVKDEAERKKKAAEAKQAGFDVKGEGAAGAVSAESQSLRASLEKAWDAQEGRV